MHADRDEARQGNWPAKWRGLASVIIAVHFSCVILAAAVIPPSSALVGRLHLWALPYLQAMYLNHGFRFFAPEPGPTHVVQYDADGSRQAFPDRRTNWPRLRYHRWFMLSESMFVDADRYMNPQQIMAWQNEELQIIEGLRNEGRLREALEYERNLAQRVAEQEVINEMAKELAESVRRVLSSQHGSGAVDQVKSVTRNIPSPADVLAGYELDDDRFMPADGQIDLSNFQRGGPELISPRSDY